MCNPQAEKAEITGSSDVDQIGLECDELLYDQGLVTRE
jgi:hypothetical protein